MLVFMFASFLAGACVLCSSLPADGIGYPGGMTDHISGPHLIPNCGREAMVTKPGQASRSRPPTSQEINIAGASNELLSDLFKKLACLSLSK